MHVLPESIEIGAFAVTGNCLQAEIHLVLGAWADGKEYRRSERLAIFVEPIGDEIGVAVYDAVLDMPSLLVVAEHAAARLDTAAGRALLKMAAEAPKQPRRWLPQVRVPFPKAGAE